MPSRLAYLLMPFIPVPTSEGKEKEQLSEAFSVPYRKLLRSTSGHA
jgi:hypothetical protein